MSNSTEPTPVETRATRPLTSLVHERLRVLVGAGDTVVDATVGNGHDTCFVAELVGCSGRVYGFDIQARALQASRERLVQLGLLERVSLIQAGHEFMTAHVPVHAQGRLAAVIFNLGYLPGADKSITTQPQSTIDALCQAFGMLGAGGALSVLVYVGHNGGMAELAVVEDWLLEVELDATIERRVGPAVLSPRLFFLRKR